MYISKDENDCTCCMYVECLPINADYLQSDISLLSILGTKYFDFWSDVRWLGICGVGKHASLLTFCF